MSAISAFLPVRDFFVDSASFSLAEDLSKESKPGTLKVLLEQVLAEMGSCKIRSWGRLNTFAIQAGVKNPQAVVAAYLAQQILGERTTDLVLIIEDAIIRSIHLSEKERYELIRFAADLGLGYRSISCSSINWNRVLGEHLKTLRLDDSDLLAWAEIFKKETLYSFNKGYFLLISNRSLFENPDNHPKALIDLIFAVFQKKIDGHFLVSVEEQQSIILDIKWSLRGALIHELSLRPELEVLLGPLFPEGGLEIIRRTFDEVGLFTRCLDLQGFITALLLRKSVFREIWGEDDVWRTVNLESFVDLFSNIARFFHKFSKPLFDVLKVGIRTRQYDLQNVYLDAVLGSFNFPGVNAQRSQTIVQSLFFKSIRVELALHQLYALGQLSFEMLEQLGSCDASLIPSVFIKLVTFPHELIDQYTRFWILLQFNELNRKAYVGEVLSYFYEPSKPLCFYRFLKWLEISKENLREIASFHMSYIGVAESTASLWADSLAHHEDLCQLLPLFHDREFFITTSGASPFAAVALITHYFELDLPSKKERCFKALGDLLDEKTAVFIALSCRSLSACDLSALNFEGSNHELLISILVTLLQKPLKDPSALELTDRLKLIKQLPLSIVLKLHTSLMKHPEMASALFQNMMCMDKIEMQVGGESNNTWEPLVAAIFAKLPRRITQSRLQEFLKKQLDLIDPTQTEKKPVSWIENLAKEGWLPFKILGRTHVFQKLDGSCLALKWQKQEEDEFELFKEATTLRVLREKKEFLGLLSDYPTPLGVYQFEGDLPKDYFDKTPVLVKAVLPGQTKLAYCYTCTSSDYFIYLHDPLKEPSSSKYTMARQRLICDLFTLAKNGLIFSQMADIFHRSEASRVTRDDAGRYMAMNFLVREYVRPWSGPGNGRLHHIEKAVEYVNAGYSGLRDVGDSILLEEFVRPGFKFSEQHFSVIIKNQPEKALTYILANFLAEYLLVYELTITERLFKSGNGLDWQDPVKVNQLAKELREGFHGAMRYYCGISSSLATRFLDKAGIDWERASRQLQFWSRKDEKGYLPFDETLDFPREIYGPEVEVEGRNWDEEGLAGWDFTPGTDPTLTRHRGDFNGTDPVKESERARVIVVQQMLLLEESRKQAQKLYFEAYGYSIEGPGQNLEKALDLYQQAKEYWPFDKKIYEGLKELYQRLGDTLKADEVSKEKAALVIQKFWEDYLRSARVLFKKTNIHLLALT